jgi:hypothetical protein
MAVTPRGQGLAAADRGPCLWSREFRARSPAPASLPRIGIRHPRTMIALIEKAVPKSAKLRGRYERSALSAAHTRGIGKPRREPSETVYKSLSIGKRVCHFFRNAPVKTLVVGLLTSFLESKADLAKKDAIRLAAIVEKAPQLCMRGLTRVATTSLFMSWPPLSPFLVKSKPVNNSCDARHSTFR